MTAFRSYYGFWVTTIPWEECCMWGFKRGMGIKAVWLVNVICFYHRRAVQFNISPLSQLHCLPSWSGMSRWHCCRLTKSAQFMSRTV
jgi:hypothetical protein